MQKKEISTLLGVVIGAGCLLVAYLLEGGNVLALFGISAFLIIIGGTIGATMTSFTMKDVLSIPKLIKEAMELPGSNEADIIKMFVSMSEKARRDGLLSLESDLESADFRDNYDPILHKGLTLVVDGTDPDSIRNILDNEVHNYEFRKKHEALIFQAAGGFSPTMGIIGTVLGVVNVLGHLEDTAHLGPAIALAFIATLYGIALANMFWLPIANKLMLKMRIEKFNKELLIEGILSIQMGENPRILQERLVTFIDITKRKKFEEELGTNL
jgi:chemotaxis protein MotA